MSKSEFHKNIMAMRRLGYSYTQGLTVNLMVFGLVYYFFGFEWFMVFFAADLSRDVGVIMIRLFKEEE